MAKWPKRIKFERLLYHQRLDTLCTLVERLRSMDSSAHNTPCPACVARSGCRPLRKSGRSGGCHPDKCWECGGAGVLLVTAVGVYRSPRILRRFSQGLGC